MVIFVVLLCVIVFCPLLFRLRGGTTRALSSKYKLNKLILRVECPSQSLTPYRKSALIQKPSAQIPKIPNPVNHLDTAGNTIK